MSISTVFVNNRTQVVRLPLDVRLPEGVQKVEIRAKGKERIIAPPKAKLGTPSFWAAPQ